jgi:hypothetical protein
VSRSGQALYGSAHKKEFGRIPNSIHPVVPVTIELFRNRGVFKEPKKSLPMRLKKPETNSRLLS